MFARVLVVSILVGALGCADQVLDLTTEGADPAGDRIPGDRKGDSALPFGSGGESDWARIAERCGAPAPDEAVVYSGDFQWGYEIEAMGARFDEMYATGRRLQGRAYYDPATDRFVMPITESWGGEVVLSRRLVENVRMHIEKALARGYAEYVFFPDMGHSHLFMPQARWDAEYQGTEVSQIGQMYSRMFADPELKVLYHTAEQLQVLDEADALLPDRHLRWRFFTRNVVGDNSWAGRIDLLHEPESKANTSRDLEGHHYYGAGFGLHASKDGCFPFAHRGELLYFDLSMTELPYESSSGGVDGP